jgi:diphthamide synthase (EF-2-diphthine--ammonia ligase)
LALYLTVENSRMILKKRVTVSWSGGKDSAFALYKILQTGEYDVVALHTIINEQTRRVGMHGVREELMDEQAEAIGLPLTKLYLESSESHDAYNKLMNGYYQQCAYDKLEGVVFGDIFLEDLKQFRESCPD